MPFNYALFRGLKLLMSNIKMAKILREKNCSSWGRGGGWRAIPCYANACKNSRILNAYLDCVTLVSSDLKFSWQRTFSERESLFVIQLDNFFYLGLTISRESGQLQNGFHIHETGLSEKKILFLWGRHLLLFRGVQGTQLRKNIK